MKKLADLRDKKIQADASINFYVFRRRLSVFTLFFALLGIIFAITTCEFETQLWTRKLDLYSDDKNYSKKYPNITPSDERTIEILIGLKITVTVSTVILLILLTFEYIVKLFIIKRKTDISHIIYGITPKFIFTYFLELILCAIHPPPIELEYFWGNPLEKKIGMTRYVPTYTILTLFMFSRFYLLARCAMLYSKFKKDHGVRTIAKLNQIKLSYYFIFKSFMNLYPGRILCFFMITVYIWCCWAYRVCEMNPDENLNDGFQRSMWLVAVTFLTIGYGDITPETKCGRGVAIITGLLGVCFTALVIAVLSQSLELSREEKRTQDFLLQGEYNLRTKRAAGDLIRVAWVNYKMRKIDASPIQKKVAENNLIEAVRKFKKYRTRNFNVIEQSLSIVDLYQESVQINYALEKQFNEIETIKKELNVIARFLRNRERNSIQVKD